MRDPGFSVTVNDKRPRSPYWQATIYLAGEGGRQRRWSTRIPVGTTTAEKRASERLARRAAEDHAARLAAAAGLEARAVDGARASLKETGKRMLAQKIADGRRTRAVRSLGLLIDGHVLRFFGPDRDVRTIRRADLEAYKADLRGRGLGPVTINNALTAARQVLKHACAVDELLEFVPHVGAVVVSKEPKGRALTTEEVLKWTAAPVATSPPAPPEGKEPKGQPTSEREAIEAQHLLVFIANTALRRAEALAVRFSWVDWATKEIRFPAEFHKGGRPRAPVAINTAAAEVLRARQALHHQRRQPDDDRVFRKNARSLREATRAAERAGLGEVRLHDLRHTRATQLHAAGASLVEVRDVLGHSTLAMVSRYGHTLPERAHQMAEAVVLGVAEKKTNKAPAQKRR